MFDVLNFIENSVSEKLNKANDSLSTCGIANISTYVLIDHESSLISKGPGFCPHSRAT